VGLSPGTHTPWPQKHTVLYAAQVVEEQPLQQGQEDSAWANDAPAPKKEEWVELARSVPVA